MGLFMALLAVFATLSAHPGIYLATGSRGTEVMALQTALRDGGLSVAEDGVYGPQTASAVRTFQIRHGLNGDGRVGLATAEALVASHLPTSVLRLGSQGAAVDAVQSLLVMDGASLVADGKFGPQTEAAVKGFQRDHDLAVDGVVGAKTWAGLADPEVTVARGDTLAQLSAPYGILPLTVARANNVNPNLIHPGEVIWFPVFGSAAPAVYGGSKASGGSGGSKGATPGPKPSSSASSESTAAPTAKTAWGGAATPSISFAFYGPPDPVLVAGVARLGIPVTVFVSSKPSSSLPSGVTLGIDALPGSPWPALASALKGPGTDVMALAGANQASGSSFSSYGLVPVVCGTIATGTSSQAIEQEIITGAEGGELEAIPLSAAGLRAASAAISTLEAEGYVLESASALYGL